MHCCEDCIFFELCTPHEQQVDNFNGKCKNYSDLSGDQNCRLAYWSVGLEKYMENLWNYKEDTESEEIDSLIKKNGKQLKNELF